VNPVPETAIAQVYAGPLEAFIPRRDALAKELRTAGKREEAAAVKALRKPSRLAWVLNAAVQQDAGAIDALVARVMAVLKSQAQGGDVRGSLDALRSAVRGFADQAGQAAERQGHSADHADLVHAALAVMGEAAAFEALRAGRLVDVPEPGGLDFLAWLPTPTRPTPEAAPSAVATAASSAALDAAEAALAAARTRAAQADLALDSAESGVARAEEQLRAAEQTARDRRTVRDRARHDALEAARALMEAERAQADVRARQGLNRRS
jgi:hypothetical protein